MPKNWRTCSKEKLSKQESIARMLHPHFPGITPQDVSKWNRPDYYGSRPVPDAERIMGTPKKKPVQAKRKYEHRYYFRLPTGLSARFQRAMKLAGYAHNQDALYDLAVEFVKKIESENQDGQTA